MAPSASRGNFVFRHEEKLKAKEILRALDDEYATNRSGAVRPTVSVLAARLQGLRNHALGRQKKKYLESLAEQVLDDQAETKAVAKVFDAVVAKGAAAKEAAVTNAANGTQDASKTQGTAAVMEATENGAVQQNKSRDLVSASTTALPMDDLEGSTVADPGATSETTTPQKRKRPASSNSRLAVTRKRRRRHHEDAPRRDRGGFGGYDDEDDEDDETDVAGDGRRRGRKHVTVAPTPILPGGPTLEDFAGMDDLLDECLELVWMPLVHGADFAMSGCRPNSAILLYGPSGCGKTLLAHVLAAEVGVPFFSVSGPALVGGISGESETNIRRIFDEARRQAPSLLFLDELEAFAGKQDAAGGRGAMEMRMALTLAECLDRLNWGSTRGGSSETGADADTDTDGQGAVRHVVVIAATNKADSLDPIVRRRFGVERAVRMPGQAARACILQTMTRGMRVAADVDLGEIARMTPGFVGGDLQNVVTTAQRNYMKTVLNARLARLREKTAAAVTTTTTTTTVALATTPTSDVRQDFRLLQAERDRERETEQTAIDTNGAEPAHDNVSVSVDVDGRLVDGVTMADFQKAAQAVLPAAKREGFSTIPNTTWQQVGAMEVLREKLEMSIIGPIRHPDKYAAVGLKPVGGILLWGPPGCGKTLVAKAVANESKANFISVRGPELLNKWVGESERALRELFERARAMAPCIVFFDEMDALAAKRDDARSDGSARIVNTLLTELDGVVDRTGIFVIGATNRPDMIDPALKRPGRLGESIFVGPPTAPDRVAILRTLYRNAVPGAAAAPADDKALALLDSVARDVRCAGFSGADLEHLLRAAGRNSLRRMGLHSAELPRITCADWEVALAETQASTRQEELERYMKLQ